MFISHVREIALIIFRSHLIIPNMLRKRQKTEENTIQAKKKKTEENSEAATRSIKHFSSITNLSPGRARRATFSSGPTLGPRDTTVDAFEISPSKRREKARSSGNLNSMLGPISPLSVLQKELEKGTLLIDGL